MRFIADGPSIPDRLLEERDRGNVVFFCGAGVSLSAGMPNFGGLCSHVIKSLGAPSAAQSRKMLELHNRTDVNSAALPAFDQIFNMLQQEYARPEIDYQISRHLKPKRSRPLTAHETVLRLSKSAEGKHQIVTTNFDYLFERAIDEPLKRYVAPALPDLATGQDIDGLVYLHGRINGNMRRGDGLQGFVLTSSDFGKAYLAEGWATRFVRDLLDRYTVILLGYSASDPPVRYLLQGLHARTQGQRPSIYAFDGGRTEEEVRQRWRDSGVKPLTYIKDDSAHSILWNTLKAWAVRADDPTGWRQAIVQLAQEGPKTLKPEERGQVVSILKTDTGASQFSDAVPPPPGEWLLVLDPNFRFVNVNSELIPRPEYCLDDDVERSANARPLAKQEKDLLGLQEAETNNPSRTRIAGVPSYAADPLTQRLFHLSRWIASVAHEPIVVWWARPYATLHPELLRQLEVRLQQESSDFPTSARKAWRLLAERSRWFNREEIQHLWYKTKQRIAMEGWTPGVLRSFALATLPFLDTRVPIGRAHAVPAENTWFDKKLKHIVELEVKFPPYERIDQGTIPDHAVPLVYKTLRHHLEYAADLLGDIDTDQWWRTTTLHSEDRRRNDRHVDESSSYLHWFRSILDRQIELDPDLVRHDYALWPKEERFFFDKLRLYLWSLPGLVEASTVATDLLALSDDAFWEHQHSRELLMLLKSRWTDLPTETRSRIENRIVEGIPNADGVDESRFSRIRSITSATMLGWLQQEGCSLTSATVARLPELRSADSSWNPEWDKRAARSNDPYGGWYKTETDPSPIDELPLDEIIPAAAENTGDDLDQLIEHRPFDGLVAVRPARAVAALTHASRRGEWPIVFWRSALLNWPENCSPRLQRLFAERLAQLPQESIFELRFELFGWAEKNLRPVAQADLDRALQILDALLVKLLANSVDATRSGLGATSSVGGVHRKSRRTFAHAINSPIGDATQLLLFILEDLRLDQQDGIPESIRIRLERLSTSPGEGCDHAVCIITRHIRYLFHIDPLWTSATVAPWLNLEHLLAEPAWNGFLRNEQLPVPELFSQIRADFCTVVGKLPGWSWDDSASHTWHRMLVQACLWHRPSRRFISIEEARVLLQGTIDSGRVHCLGILRSILRDDNKLWRRFVKPFLEQAWPRELRFQTEATSNAFAELAESANEFFPEVVDSVVPFLTRVSKPSAVMYTFENNEENDEQSLATRFPRHTLKLFHALVPDIPQYVPFDLRKVLEMIGDADQNLRQDNRWRRLHQIAVGG